MSHPLLQPKTAEPASQTTSNEGYEPNSLASGTPEWAAKVVALARKVPKNGAGTPELKEFTDVLFDRQS